MDTFSFLQRDNEKWQNSKLSDLLFAEKSMVHDIHLNALIKTVKNDHMLCHICRILQKEKSFPIRTESLYSIKQKWYFSDYTLNHLNIVDEDDIKKIISLNYRKILMLLKKDTDTNGYINNYILYEIMILSHIKKQDKVFIIEEFKKEIKTSYINIC